MATKTALTFGSLFAGIGGIDLGLERAGMTCKWQVEIDDYATKVLEKHWSNVARLRDVRDCGKDNLETVDLICGGFPCQDVSLAGKRKGLKGRRTTLWSEFYRIICEVKPRWILVENVPGLLSSDDGRFFGQILRDLAQGGYDAEWDCIPAAAIGAPHRRDRVYIVANRNGARQLFESAKCNLEWMRALCKWDKAQHGFGSISAALRQGRLGEFGGVPRMVDGIPNRVDRLRGLGNAVVPQVAEWIGQQIVESERQWQVTQKSQKH